MCSTPTRVQALSTLSDPNTLVRIASHAKSSSIGTCLCAAAWKTTSGRASPEDLVDDGRVADVGQRELGMARRAVAARRGGGSRRDRGCTRAAGSNSATWRAISEPIQPPPPVTRTRRPRQEAAHRLEVDAHRLATQEVLDVELTDVAEPGHAVRPTRPEVRSTRTGTPTASAPSATRRTIARGASGIGEQDLVDAVLAQHAGQVVDVAADGHAVDRAPPQRRGRRPARRRGRGRDSGSAPSRGGRTPPPRPRRRPRRGGRCR